MTPSSNTNQAGLNGLRFLLFFFVVFTLFMTAGLPLIIHYAGGEWKWTPPGQSAAGAFIWLGVGCFLWVLVLILFVDNFILSQFRKKRLLERLLQNGRHARGTVVQKQVLQAGGRGDLLALKVAFRNLVDAEVETTLSIVDAAPSLNRFSAGRTVSLILDPEMGDPPVMVEGKGFQWNRTVMTLVVLVLFILLTLAPGLLVYSYMLESRGYGWRYLSFGHPFILIPFIIGIELTIYTLIRKLSRTKRKASKLLLYGRPATATIVSTAQTGVYINEQPQVRFTIEFEGSRGRTHQASFKQVVDLLKIPDIAPGKTINILYDPEHPEQIQPLD
ncbi:hypothetical protein LL912_22605 [Niabella sp. CC-SYL272]|uniref:hypothetical protein n=1 Tax=Niabella agricola TaxID=2891571 RepID=UPI001F35D284|nr:hypothetical protein [Niabella agricola]MCF3111595.1 hypothetical protein [Niabella agricola]